MGRDAFIERVWEQKTRTRGNIIGQLKRLGASCDWDREAFTMGGAKGDPEAGNGAPNFHDAVIKVFVEMYNKGLIYRGKRLVNWDPHFETAISDLEVENVEVAGHMWHFKYPLAGGETYTYIEKDADGVEILREERDYISIATTRPETMLGDGAVAVNPRDERYAPIVGKLCEIPVGPKEHRRLIPIITDDYPDMEFGSGAVKITGAHDPNDYLVAKRAGIPLYNLMDTKAAMRADGRGYAEEASTALRIARGEEDFDEAKIAAMNLVPDDYRGLDRFKARKKVIADITAEGLAVMTQETFKDDDGNEATRSVPLVENKPIMQPFCDRSKVVMEPMLTDQWFVDASKIVGPALDSVRDGRTTILPKNEEKVYFHWLENIEPWCISRQLWWGHQIPVWFDGDGNQYCAATQAEAQALAGDGVELTRDPDVLDTWFSSGLWPIGTLGWPEQTAELARYHPTSTLITGTDILFFWVARMMMMQLSVVNDIPFETVYLHGLVRDAQGKKMSKTTGNVIDPIDIIDEYGADALRFANAAMASLGGVLKLDMQRIAGYRNFGTKIWNAHRFAEMNRAVGGDGTRPEPTAAVNRWIIGETAKVLADVNAALEAYRFNDAANALYAFVWGKVCDWYVELSKPLLQGDDDRHKAETQATMAWVLDQCLILLHPIMPYVTEELWGTSGDRKSMLVHAEWPSYGKDLVDLAADEELNWVISFIDSVRSARAQMNVPAGLYIPVLAIDIDPAARAAYTANEAMIKRLARIDNLSDATETPKGAISVNAGASSFALPLKDIIDVEKEEARLSKNLLKLEKEIKGLEGRVKNPKFAQSAPAEVVEEAKANLSERQSEAEIVRAALARLAEI
jgi:valyl-tRNA synthetase